LEIPGQPEIRETLEHPVQLVYKAVAGTLAIPVFPAQPERRETPDQPDRQGLPDWWALLARWGLQGWLGLPVPLAPKV